MKKIIEKAELSCNWIKKFPAKTSINIFLLGLMLLFTTAYAAKDNWVYVSEKEDGLWFVNTDTIMCRENLCKASVKMQPLAEKYEYTIELNEYICTEMKYKTLRTTTYDSNRNTMRSITPEGQEWNYVVPESVSKELYDFVCKKAPNHKEQLNTNEKDKEQLTDAPALDQLAAIAERKSFTAGQPVFGEGEADASLFIVTAGEGRIDKQVNFEQQQTLQRLQPGDFFGEMSFLTGGEHSASAVALRETEVIQLRRTEFDKLARRNPEVAYRVVLRLATQIAQLMRGMDEKFVDLVGYIWGRSKR